MNRKISDYKEYEAACRVIESVDSIKSYYSSEC